MITIPQRRLLALIIFVLILLAGVCYDSLFVQPLQRVQLLLVGCVAMGFGVLFLLQEYPRRGLPLIISSAWPLHLYTVAFVGVCVVFQGRAKLSQVVVYAVLGYATYLLVPLIFMLDRRFFRASVMIIAVLSALLALPTFAGALGVDAIAGIPIRNKTTYAAWSGVIASAGIFEHPEGNAYQMAMGLLCSWYAYRKSPSLLFAVCFGLTLVGLAISQGRAAILGVGIAVGIMLLPEVFRRSRPLFLSTITIALLLPFVMLTALAAIPGVASYLRVQRGLSGRDEAWRFAVSVIQDEPWVGHGLMASTEFTEAEKKQLRRTGFSGAGTTFHNTFITKAVDMGLVVTGLYSLLYLVPLARICSSSAYTDEEMLIRSMLILTLTTSIFRDYNVGGIRSTTMIGTFFLGVGSLWCCRWLWDIDWWTSDAEQEALPATLSHSQAMWSDMG